MKLIFNIILVMGFIFSGFVSASGDIVIFEGNNSNIQVNSDSYIYNNGKHYLVWSNGSYSTNPLYNNYDKKIKLSISTDGINWQTDNIFDTQYGSFNHKIAIDSDGKIYIAYNEPTSTGTYGGTDINLVLITNKNGQFKKTIIESGSGYSYYSPSKLFFTPDGVLHLFYQKNGWWRYNAPLYEKDLVNDSWTERKLISDLDYGKGDPDDNENMLLSYEIVNGKIILYVSSGYWHLSYQGDVKYSGHIFKYIQNENNYTKEEINYKGSYFDFKNGDIVYADTNRTKLFFNSNQILKLENETISNVMYNGEIIAINTYKKIDDSTDEYNAYIVSKTGNIINSYKNGYLVLAGRNIVFVQNNINPKRLIINPNENISSTIDLSKGLVAYYKFDGNAKDSSGNGNDGKPTSSVSFATGKFGKAAIFGGVDNPGDIYVPNSPSLKFENGATFSCWIRFDALKSMDGYGETRNTVGGGSIFAKSHDRRGAGFLANLYDNGQISAYIYNYEGWTKNTKHIKSIEGKSIGDWTHVVFTLSDINGSKIYIDGKLVAYSNDPVSFTQMNKEPLYIGKYSDSWYPFYGAIDDFRIYNRTLNDQEIEALYHMGQNDSSNANDNNSSLGELSDNGSNSSNGYSKEYIKLHAQEFGLINPSDINITSSFISNLPHGWSLIGTPFEIKDLSIFDSAKIVWIYDNENKSWSGYSSNLHMKKFIQNSSIFNLISTIPAKSGIWVYKE